MAEMRASPVVYPRLLSIAKVLQDIQGPMGQIIPGTDVNPFKLLPAAQSVENWAYGNSPFSDYPSVTNRRLPVVKTGREGEVLDLADVALMGASLPAAAKGVTRGANFLGDVLTQAVTRNPNATSMRALDEIARMTKAPQIAPNPAMVSQPAKSDLGFYSQLEAATLPLQNKGSGEQYLAQISKTPGVKPEELQWTGLDEFLRSKPSVTKSEIQDYLNANRVDVQEVRLGQNNPYADWQQKLAQAKESQDAAKINMELTLPDNLSQLNYYNLRDMWAGPAARGNQEALANIRALGLTPEQEANVLDYGRQVSLVSELKGSAPPNLNPKFSNYTLPGGENYREILLTLPDTKGAKLDARRAEIEAKGVNATDAEKQEWASIMNQLQPETRDVEGLSPFRNRPEFRSSHFDQPNILAHMRVNDRVVDGKNTLFIEEVQSDWHQAGRKKGYATGKFDRKATSVIRQPGYWEVRDQNGDFITNVMDYTLPNADEQAVLRFADLRLQKNDATNVAASKRVPDAPFKTSWHELALKRAIQEASEKGYDQIAFTTGKTQAERYDLSKQVDSLLYTKNADGTYRVSAQVQGRGQMLGEAIPESDLADYVGKEVAEKMSNGVGKQTEVQGKPIPGQWGTPKEYMTELSGEGLKVGGEGMKGFYDNILPKSLDKLGKKFGAKVQKTEMDGTEVWTMPITPQMRQSVTTKGQPLFAIPAIGTGAIAAEAYRQNQQNNFGY